LGDASGDDVGDVVELADAHDRDQVDVAGDRVDLADTLEVGDGLGHLRDRVRGAVDEHDGGNHGVMLSVTATVRSRPTRIAPTKCAPAGTTPPGQTTDRTAEPSIFAPAPTTACATLPLTVAVGSTRLPGPAACRLAAR